MSDLEEKTIGEKGDREIEVGVQVLVGGTKTGKREIDGEGLGESITVRMRRENGVMESLGGKGDLDTKNLKTKKRDRENAGNIENVIVKTRMMKQSGDIVVETLTVIGTLRTNNILPDEIDWTDVQMITGQDLMKNRPESLAIRPLDAMYLLTLKLAPVVAIASLPTCHPINISSTNLHPKNSTLLRLTLTPQSVQDLQSTVPNFVLPKDAEE